MKQIQYMIERGGKISFTTDKDDFGGDSGNRLLTPFVVEDSENLIKDKQTISEIAEEAIWNHKGKVQDYNRGENGLLGLFMGEAMKISKGLADPVLMNQEIQTQLQSM